ncbi:galactose mutarotase [Sphingobium sp. H39-3-25]|uniref:aldose epimerase family protein n=1 Tax=Sphingobium arseniciresistens TaxID=3030834 RepID=UPI0023B9865B|nr:galactose mutarotase [Sphingobium arseniciresistens]
MTIESRIFETLPDGRTVRRWDVRNASGAGLSLIDLGATILALEVPDRDGTLADVVLGFDSAAPYLTDSPYFGAVVGRFANRIAHGRFTLDGRDYQLTCNDGPNTLHGGGIGFDKRIWQGETIMTDEGEGVRLTLVSPDGEEGFPGSVTLSATYVWTPDNRLIVDYAAETTQATPFSLSQHSYWNLGGVMAESDALGHDLSIHAGRYLPVDDTLIPTGEMAPVEGTPFDFRVAKPIGQDIEAGHPQIALAGGFDHSWIADGTGYRTVAVLSEPVSGRTMTVQSDMPAMQFYSANFLDGTVSGKGGARYPRRGAVALETQHCPDAPNQPAFPEAILRPGRPFASRTSFHFTA